MAAFLRLRRAGVVASPPVTPDYSAISLPPTLPGRSGCYTLSAVPHQPTSCLAGLGRAAFLSTFPLGFPFGSDGGAGLGHLSPGAGHVFCFFIGKNPFNGAANSVANDISQNEVRVQWFQCLLSAEIPHSAAVRMPATWLFRRSCACPLSRP